MKISRKRVVLRSKYVTRWKSREIGWGSRILSRARILKGPSEFLKTRVIDPLTSGAKKKKRKSILGLETRQDWVFSRERRKEKSTNSSIRSREYRSVVEFDERSCSTNREYPLLFSRYSFTRLFSQEIDTTSAMHLRYSVFRNPHATKNNILQLPRLFYSSLHRRIKLDSQSRFLNSGFILNFLLNFNRR